MKANELRIGNLYSQFGHIHEASWVTIEKLLQAPKEQIWCKPIPLTEQWLLDFGFKKEDNNYFIEDWRLHLNSPYNYDGFLLCDGYSVIVDIETVHKLQNLYFALTNKELTHV